MLNVSYIGKKFPQCGVHYSSTISCTDITEGMARERITGAVRASTATEEMPVHRSVPQRIVCKGFSEGWLFWVISVIEKRKNSIVLTINVIVWDNTSIKIPYDLRILTYTKEKASLTYIMNMLHYFHSCALKNSWALPKVITLFQ